MEHSPRTLAALTMQHINTTGLAPTPENFARAYYEISIKPLPDLVPDVDQLLQSEPCEELTQALHELVDGTCGITDRLAGDLADGQQKMQASAEALRQGAVPEETMRKVVSLLAQASGLMGIIESSREELRQSQQALHQMEEKLAETTRQLGVDALTNTLNRRGLANCLNRETSRARRHKDKLSVIMADLDNFKRVNDTHGHDAGDRMIVHFAQLIRFVIRDTDYAARFGGEEFVLILPEADQLRAETVALRLQAILAKTPLLYEGKEISTTFSAGIAEFRANEEGAELLRRADTALYAAKAAGRNCFKLAT